MNSSEERTELSCESHPGHLVEDDYQPKWASCAKLLLTWRNLSNILSNYKY